MAEQGKITIPLAQYKRMTDGVEEMSKRYQGRIDNQVEIINRLQAEMAEFKGYKMLCSVLSDRMHKRAEQDAGQDLEEFEIVITERELVETDPRVWKGVMDNEDGLEVFRLRLGQPEDDVPFDLPEGTEIPMKEDGTPDIDKLNEMLAERFAQEEENKE